MSEQEKRRIPISSMESPSRDPSPFSLPPSVATLPKLRMIQALPPFYMHLDLTMMQKLFLWHQMLGMVVPAPAPAKTMMSPRTGAGNQRNPSSAPSRQVSSSPEATSAPRTVLLHATESALQNRASTKRRHHRRSRSRSFVSLSPASSSSRVSPLRSSSRSRSPSSDPLSTHSLSPKRTALTSDSQQSHMNRHQPHAAKLLSSCTRSRTSRSQSPKIVLRRRM